MSTYSAENRALDVLDLLDERPMTMQNVCDKLGITKSQFRSTIGYLREKVCPTFDLTIPHPVPDDEWCYHLTGEWIGRDGQPAIEAGANYAMSQIESRLRSVNRDVAVALLNIDDPQSEMAQKCRFLRHHLDHILGTLVEITAREASKRDEG